MKDNAAAIFPFIQKQVLLCAERMPVNLPHKQRIKCIDFLICLHKTVFIERNHADRLQTTMHISDFGCLNFPQQFIIHADGANHQCILRNGTRIHRLCFGSFFSLCIKQPDRETALPDLRKDREANASPYEVYNVIRATIKQIDCPCAVVLTKLDRFMVDNPYVARKLRNAFDEKVVFKEALYNERQGVVYDFDAQQVYSEAVDSLFAILDPASHLNGLNNVFSRVKRFACQAFETKGGNAKQSVEIYRQKSVHLSDPVIWLILQNLAKKGII